MGPERAMRVILKRDAADEPAIPHRRSKIRQYHNFHSVREPRQARVQQKEELKLAKAHCFNCGIHIESVMHKYSCILPRH
jgi:hypothetical protein